MLTGKAKELFEEWYNIQRGEKGHYYFAIDFNNLPLSFQWGVYLEFADSLGYIVSVYKDVQQSNSMWWCIDKDWVIGDGLCSTRKEAQTETLKKLNEIINSEG